MPIWCLAHCMFRKETHIQTKLLTCDAQSRITAIRGLLVFGAEGSVSKPAPPDVPPSQGEVTEEPDTAAVEEDMSVVRKINTPPPPSTPRGALPSQGVGTPFRGVDGLGRLPIGVFRPGAGRRVCGSCCNCYLRVLGIHGVGHRGTGIHRFDSITHSWNIQYILHCLLPRCFNYVSSKRLCTFKMHVFSRFKFTVLMHFSLGSKIIYL